MFFACFPGVFEIIPWETSEELGFKLVHINSGIS